MHRGQFSGHLTRRYLTGVVGEVLAARERWKSLSFFQYDNLTTEWRIKNTSCIPKWNEIHCHGGSNHLFCSSSVYKSSSGSKSDCWTGEMLKLRLWLECVRAFVLKSACPSHVWKMGLAVLVIQSSWKVYVMAIKRLHQYACTLHIRW